MGCRLSVVVPNRNGADTIGLCLAALFCSEHDDFEVIVIDDGSEDDSRAIISRFPCRLIALNEHRGSAAARNIGAGHSRGRILFFIDGDCLVQADTLRRAEELAAARGPGWVIGGTYTPRPFDRTFYSTFQSLFVNYFETKKGQECDYVAGHAMVIHRQDFLRGGGFPDRFLPLIEDVEFSHRLRAVGCRLLMAPGLQVRHVFNFRSARDSLGNAYQKSKYWTVYSLARRDLLADSGTASRELKVTVMAWSLIPLLAGLAVARPGTPAGLLLLGLILGLIGLNRGLFARFVRSEGWMFALRAAGFYLLLYPPAVAAGALAGLIRHFRRRELTLRAEAA